MQVGGSTPHCCQVRHAWLTIHWLPAGVADLWDSNDMWAPPLFNALAAKDCYIRDVHYIVKDGKVVSVDEFTGRAIPNRR
eukprot:194731-Pyramimonas_sp.AAC.2